MKNNKLLVLAVLVATILGLMMTFTSVTLAQSQSCKGTPNENPVLDVAPVLIKTTTNGKRYRAGGDGDDSIHLLHVYGTPYDWGRAVGELMKEELNIMLPNYFKYLDKQIESYLTRVPEYWRKIIAEYGLNIALDLNWEITKKYTPDRFTQELHGLADGSGLDMKLFRRINLLPELIKAGCSMYGAWSNATRSEGGNLFQLRALDWDSNAPIKSWPSMIVYHPNDGSHSFANIGYPGLIGVITGYSSSNIGISEKVWLGHPAGYDSRFGMPWTYVLRDILQYDSDLNSAIHRLTHTNRTCSIHVGVGDSTTGEFRGIEYSYKHVNIYDWNNQPEYDNHPRLPYVVYWDKHVQPTGSNCYSSLLQKYYGSLNVENTRQVCAISQTGDMQIAIYDFAKNQVYVANAKAEGEQGPPLAYDRSYVKFDMNTIFAESL